MSIKIYPETKSFGDDYDRLISCAKFSQRNYLYIGNGDRQVGITHEDPDVHILTEAIRAYAEARMERCRLQDQIDKINLAHELINELGEALLNQKPEERA